MARKSVAFFKVRWVVVAIVAVLVTLIPVLLIQSLISPRLVLPFFFVAVLISTWRGGALSGVLAIVLSVVVLEYIVPLSGGLLPADRAGLERLCVFLFVSLLIIALGAARNRSEEKARKADEIQRATIESSPLAMLVLDRDLNVALWNPAAERMFGWNESEVAGRSLRIIPEDLREEHRRRMEAQFEGAGPRAFRVRQLKKDGSLIDVSISSATLRDARGAITGVLLIMEEINDRKRLEEQIHFQTSLLDQVRNAVIVVDLENRILLWNKHAETIYQWKAEEVHGRNVLDLIVPDDVRGAGLENVEILKRTGHWEGEGIVRRKDGSEFPASFHGAVIRATNGEVIGLVGLHTDITERKQLDRELKDSENRFRSFMDHMPGFAWIKDAEGGYVYMNKSLQEVLPKHQNDWIGRTDAEIWRPEVAAEYQRNDQQVLKHAERLQVFETWDKEDHVRHMLVSKFPIINGQGNVLVGGASIDITEQEEAQEALRESHNFQRAVVEATPDAIFVKDREGRYQMINSAGASFLGKPIEEIIGRNDTDLFTLEVGTEIMRRDQEVMTSGKAQTFEETVAAGGIKATFLSTKDVYRDSKGAIVGLIGIARDITGRKRAEERLQEYEKAVEGLEDMIVVVDREYRYLLANRAFLSYRGLEREQVVGRLASEVMDREVFERVVRPRVDECLQGKAINYETRYTYPAFGERDLFISYFPVEGPDGVDRVVCILRDITDRKRAEEALRESEERFSKAFHSSPAALSISSLEDGRLMEVNTAYLELTGYSQNEVLRRTSLDLGFWASADQRMTMVKALRERGAVRDLETRFRKKSGELRNVVLSVELIELRAIPCLLGIVEDVTDRKRAEEALRASEERYRDLVENAQDIIYSHDLEGNYTSVNEAVEQITGYSRDEVLEMNFAAIIAPEYADKARSMIRRKLAGESERVYDLEIVAKDGRRIAFEVNARLIHQDGVPVGVHGIARDVTERKLAQEELRESEERYRDLVENSTELICTHDLDGLILSANKAAIEVLGYDSKDYLGKKSVRDFLPAEDRAEFQDYLARLRTTGVATGLMRVQTKAGERRIWEYRNTLRTEGLVQPIVRGMARDITERRKAEEQLKATSDQLRALSASLRSAREEEGTRIARELHDEMGSSLTGLRFDLEEVHRSLSGLGDEAAVSRLQEKIANMTRLTDGTINTVRRISSELRPSLLDDLGLVAAIEWEAQQFAARSGIPCRCHCFVEHLDLGRERATAVFRVFQEALTNILRHAKASRVNVTMTEEQAELVLEVRDDGSGITDAERADPRSLGLTGMRERVHLAGGTIEITGAAGAGTVLTVRVPGSLIGGSLI